MKCLIWVICLICVCAIDGGKILGFFPMPTRSHQRFMQPLLRELAARGHQVDLYVPYLAVKEYPPTLNVTMLPDYLSTLRKKMGLDEHKRGEKSGSIFIGEDGLQTLMNAVWFRQLGWEVAEWMFQQTEFKQLVESDKSYDLVFLAATYFQEPFIALGHRFNASVITFLPSSNLLWAHFVHGNPYDTSYIIDCMNDLTHRLNFGERLYLTASNIFIRLVNSLYFNPLSRQQMDKYVRYPGWEERPSLGEMLSQTSLVLTNSHVAVSYPYPFAPHFKEIGGVHLQLPRPLPKDLQDFMDGAKDGVIYFSLGSLADVSSILSEETGEKLLKMFSQLKQRVLWKWEKEIQGLTSNVIVSDWFPQQDILRHANMALFITHGGLLSLIEAIDSGVPTIGIPMAGDQMKNVRHMEYFGYGVRLKLTNLTAESLLWAIEEILNNPKYQENAKKRSQLFRDKAETAMDTAVFWSEYVIRHDGAHHLKPVIATMPWYQQAMIDVYAALALTVLIPIYTFIKVLKLLLCMCSCCSNNVIQRKIKVN